ncbi:hypothetical protein RA265_29555, partial [Pseudomonas syringae pv. tagetis]|uniref:hypothetical protein n=1 Tax=Pseudomonas syringae group genomosp. 7 TaxID=251699 RepID=UPI00376FB691
CQVDPPIKQVQVFVYNHKFIEKNFDHESHPGIFTLNEGNIEAIEKIAEIQQSLEPAYIDVDRIKRKLSEGDEGDGRSLM